MQFNDHWRLAGKHAFLSASKYSWLRYSDDKLRETFDNAQEAQRGTDLHAFASEAVRLRIKLPRTRKTMNLFVNDMLGFRMTSEQMLRYSDNIFGTADGIGFRDDILRIFDLKNGVTKASFDQLLIYAAIFCLEYGIHPSKIKLIELRIYQNDDVKTWEPTLEDVTEVMEKIVYFDTLIDGFKAEANA
jgi:hypothetical protein